MVLTPLKITSDDLKIKGTGRFNKQEVFPCTEYLMKKIGIKDDVIKRVLDKQQTLKTELKDKTINGLRPYQIEDVKFLSARKNCACFNEQRTGKTPTALRSLL